MRMRVALLLLMSDIFEVLELENDILFWAIVYNGARDDNYELGTSKHTSELN